MSGIRRIDTAFQCYLTGGLCGWDLLTIVQSEGFSGFSVDSQLNIILH
jgi:hypothetical protein